MRDMSHTAPSGPKHLLATIDVGGNSISLEVRTVEEPIIKPGRYAALKPDDDFELPPKFKKFCGLAAGIGHCGKLSKDSRDCGIDTLKEIAARINALEDAGHDVEVIAVGTAPFRDAKNGAAYKKRIKKETGIDLRILTPNEEAAYAAAGVTAYFPKLSAIVIDTGGGSTEFALVEDGTIKDTFSLPLGTRRIEEADDPEAFIAAQLATLPEAFTGREDLPLVLTGGTFRALCKYFERVHNHSLDDLLTPTTVPLQGVFNHAKELSTMIARAEKSSLTTEELAFIFQVNEDRVPRIPTATRLLEALKNKTGAQTTILTSATMRDGLRVERAGALDKPFEMTADVAGALQPRIAVA